MSMQIWTDEHGKLSSTRLMALVLVVLLCAVVVAQVWCGRPVEVIVYDTLRVLILGLVGVTGARVGLKTFKGDQ